MAIALSQLPSHLSKTLSPLYVVHGDAPLLVIEAADLIRAAARTHGYSEREVLVATASWKWADLFEAAGNLSLFGGAKLIDLRIPTGKPGREGSEALKNYCAQLPSGLITLVSLPELDWATRKSGWFVALSEHAHIIECNAPALAQLPAWISERLARQEQSAPRVALEFIAAHVEGNLLAAHQEIQKLALLYPVGQLSLADVEAAVLNVARFDINNLREALINQDAARCARVLDGLRAEGAAPPLILWTLANEARTRAQKAPALRRVARSVLLQAAKTDRMIKGVAKGDIWDEFLQLALLMTRKTQTG